VTLIKRLGLVLLLSLIPVYCCGLKKGSPPQKEFETWALGQKELIEKRMTREVSQWYSAQKLVETTYRSQIARARGGVYIVCPDHQRAKEAADIALKRLSNIDREFDRLELLVKTKNGGKLPGWWHKDTHAWHLRKQQKAEYEDWLEEEREKDEGAASFLNRVPLRGCFIDTIWGFTNYD
jgi:hypothetical protein